MMFSTRHCIGVSLGGVPVFHRLTERDVGQPRARAAQDAATMLRNHGGAWSDDRRAARSAKPPMYYWLVATVASLRGTEVDSWAVRLPAAIAATLTVLLVYVFLDEERAANRGHTRSNRSCHRSAFHLAGPHRSNRHTLTLCVAVAVLSICMTRRWHIVGYLAIAGGLLLKGRSVWFFRSP